MAERPLIQLFRDRFFGRRKTFWPTINHSPVETYRNSRHNTPAFNVPLMPGDKRMINNLEMVVHRMPQSLGRAEVVFRETKEYIDGHERLLIDDVWTRNGVIQIGSEGVIVLRKIKGRGRMQFSMAMPKGVDVHSRAHRKKRTKIAA